MTWVWASPPHHDLTALAARLDAGDLPDSRVTLKDNRLRSVWALPDVAGGVLLKCYRRRAGEQLKTLWMGGRAEREYRAMETLVRYGLPTPRPWAYRQARGDEPSWLLGRLVPRARTLAEALEHAGPARARTLVERALELVADLHGHPVLHRDLHAGNLLLDAADRPQIIDLHSLWNVRRLRDARRWENLARLFASLRVFVDISDWRERVAVYAARRGEARATVIAGLEAALAAFHGDYVRGRTARCLKASSEFVPERVAGRRVFRRRDYAAGCLVADLDEHARHVAAGDLLGDAPAAQVSLVARDDPTPRVLKHFRRRGPLRALRQALGRGRGRSAWVAARRCDLEGLPTPRALALAEEDDGSAWLVCEHVAGATTLRDHLTRSGSDRRLAFAVGHVLGRLSRAGLWHDDLSAKNLLVRPGPAWQPRDLRLRPRRGLPDIQLIDLDNMSTTRPHDPAALVRMAGQLADVPVELTATIRQQIGAGFRRAAGRSFPANLATRALAAGAARQQRRAARASR